jgi:hypothetical protein
VLVSSSLAGLTPGVSRNLSNPLVYGMRAYVGYSALGPLLLYEQNSSVPAEQFGPGVPQTAVTYLPSTGLTPGPKGVEVTNSSSPSGMIIESVGGVNRTGLAWSGPNAFLAPGNYTLTIEVAVACANLTLHPKQGTLRVELEGLEGIPLDETLPASRFVSGVWTNLTVNVSLEDPLPKMNIEQLVKFAPGTVALFSERGPSES